MNYDLPTDPFKRLHIGKHGAFIHRTNEALVPLARAAVALRMDVPVGSIEVDWEALRAKAPVKLRRAA